MLRNKIQYVVLHLAFSFGLSFAAAAANLVTNNAQHGAQSLNAVAVAAHTAHIGNIGFNMPLFVLCFVSCVVIFHFAFTESARWN